MQTDQFQSTPPCRERLPGFAGFVALRRFQSTPPCRERRCVGSYRTTAIKFQSTPPCRERHAITDAQYSTGTGFNPRPHVGSDPPSWGIYATTGGFNPRPHVGSDHKSWYHPLILTCFNPRPHVGSDRDHRRAVFQRHRFQSTPPCRERLLQSNSLCYNRFELHLREGSDS